MINYDIGGEYITQKLVATIEEKKKVPAFPLQYYKLMPMEDNGIPIYCLNDISKITPSFNMFHKLNVAKMLKEELCKVCEVKTEV